MLNLEEVLKHLFFAHFNIFGHYDSKKETRHKRSMKMETDTLLGRGLNYTHTQKSNHALRPLHLRDDPTS